tara:strand:+ start:2429 stop:2821 length:393 start_codon:yes stop_codon:yes gene_type:complete
MNYIDITSTSDQSIQVNVNVDGLGATTEAISWTISKDGNDNSLDALTSIPDGSHYVTDHGYYQMLHLDLFGTGIAAQMEDESHYTIEGILDAEVVYRGKFLTTTQTLDAYTVNADEYEHYNSTNNYTILD